MLGVLILSDKYDTNYDQKYEKCYLFFANTFCVHGIDRFTDAILLLNYQIIKLLKIELCLFVKSQ